MKIWSVELRGNLWNDDTFTGTFEECIAYCNQNGYDIDGNEARIAEIESDDGYCYRIVYSCGVAL